MKIFKQMLRIILASILIILIFGLKEFFKTKAVNLIDTATGVESKEDFDMDFKKYRISNSTFIIKSPQKIVSTSKYDHTVNYKYLSEFEAYEFVENELFEGTILYMKRNDGINFSAKQGFNATINNLKKLPGVDKVIENKNNFDQNGLTGLLFDGIMIRYGKSGFFKGVIAERNNENISVMLLSTDIKNNDLINNIINSIIQID